MKTILTLTLQAIDIVVVAMRMCLVDATKATQSKMKTKPNIDERIAFQLVEPNTHTHCLCIAFVYTVELVYARNESTNNVLLPITN